MSVSVTEGATPIGGGKIYYGGTDNVMLYSGEYFCQTPGKYKIYVKTDEKCSSTFMAHCKDLIRDSIINHCFPESIRHDIRVNYCINGYTETRERTARTSGPVAVMVFTNSGEPIPLEYFHTVVRKINRVLYGKMTGKPIVSEPDFLELLVEN